MPPAARGKAFASCLTEGVRHVTRRGAGIAFDPKIFGLERRTTFEEPERARASRWPVVHEVMPREIVDVSIAARQ